MTSTTSHSTGINRARLQNCTSATCIYSTTPSFRTAWRRSSSISRATSETTRNHVVFSHIVAEADLVVLHLNSKADEKDRGRAIVDIFRVENGKIIEHWDVTQDLPEK